MPIIGVTGSFGSGKSVVAGMFMQHGAAVFDADKAVHGLMAGKGAAVSAVRRQFGCGVVNAQGVDRAKLAELVFTDDRKLKQLMAIIHPLVRRQAEKFIRTNARRPLLVLDVPLLIESGWLDLVDVVCVVRARREQQLLRVNRRSGIGRRAAVQRIRSQMPLKEKLKYADLTIDNTNDLAATDQQVRKIIENIKREERQRKVLIKQRPNRREV